MIQELQDLKKAMEAGAFDTAREIADTYVVMHPDEFNDHYGHVANAANEAEALATIVNMCEKLRDAGLEEHQLRAEAFHLHRWHPQDIGGVYQPAVREDGDEDLPAPAAQPKVRNQPAGTVKARKTRSR